MPRLKEDPQASLRGPPPAGPGHTPVERYLGYRRAFPPSAAIKAGGQPRQAADVGADGGVLMDQRHRLAVGL